MKQNAPEAGRPLFAVLRAFFVIPAKLLRAAFFWLAKPVLGHPIFTWILTGATAATFAGEALNLVSDSSERTVIDYWLALALWVFASVVGPLFIRFINRRSVGITAARRQWAASITAASQLIWVGLTALFWLCNSNKFGFGSPAPVHGLLASLLLLPSFSLNLILLQRGQRDQGFDADVILVNKTGTLTTGNRKLAFIKVAANSRLRNQDAVLALAAGVVSDASDDLAKAILDRAKRRKIDPVEVKDVMSIAGLGRAGRLEGSRVVLGGPDQLVSHNTRIEVVDLVRADQANTEGQTVLYLLIDGDLCGYLGFADQVRNDVKFFVHLLQYRRKRVLVYSGDAHETTKYVANQLDCDGFYGEVLPHEHDNLIEKISSDGSVILESNDLSATALQVERAVRDRRLQWVTVLVSLVTPVVGLILGAVKLMGSVRPSILLPAADVAFGLLFAMALIAISRKIWLLVPKTISQATLESDDDDD